MVAKIAEQLPGCAPRLPRPGRLRGLAREGVAVEQADPPDDLAMLVGTGGTTGLPKGVMLTARNLETMTALTLMGYPFSGRPAYLALAPLTHAAGVLCFPVLALGGRIVVMRAARPRRASSRSSSSERITHTFLPPTLIYMLLGHEAIAHHRPLLAAVLLVRRGADVDRAARGGADADRARDGAAVRPERGADDGLDAPARRALRRGRDGRDGGGWPRPGGPRRSCRSGSWTPRRARCCRPASAARSSCAARS